MMEPIAPATHEQTPEIASGYDPVLASMTASVHALRTLNGLEVAGRTMITFMRGHMSEIHSLSDAETYFHQFYDDVAREFVQLDDEDFAIHHCARILFQHWMEEMDRAREGPLGVALSILGSALPEISTPTRAGRSPIAASWYGDIVKALQGGSLPPERQPLNPIMEPSDCVLRESRDLIWPQFLVWCGETWARQVVVMWELVREAIRMRREIEQRQSHVRLDALIAQNQGSYRTVADEMKALYEEWHAFHAGTVDVHDPMYDKNLQPLFDWLGSFGPELTTWLIKEPTKNEMYVEVAFGIATLRGEPFSVECPEFRYWRRTPWTPEVIRVGAPGMPPFE